MPEENVNLKIFQSIKPVLSNEGMRINPDKFTEYLEFTFNTKSDITYEEYLGFKPSQRVQVDLGMVESVIDKGLKGLAIIQKFSKKR